VVPGEAGCADQHREAQTYPETGNGAPPVETID
jgi:hypothetical protein